MQGGRSSTGTRVAIHGQGNRNFIPYIVRYETILEHNGVESCRVDISDDDFWERISACDAFIFRWTQSYDVERQIAHNIIPIVEGEMGKKVFPDWQTCWHFDNKIAQYYLLKTHGWPIEKCWIFYDEQSALAWADGAEYPVVAKLTGGAASRNVKLVTGAGQARRLIKRLFWDGIQFGGMDHGDKVTGRGYVKAVGVPIKKALLRLVGRGVMPRYWVPHQHYALFQRYLPDNPYDMRIFTIGQRAFGYRRFQRPGDFRASGSQIKDLNHRNIDLDCVKISLEISERHGFQSMGYDFFYDRSGAPRLLEICYTIPELAVVNLPGYWDAELNWHEGNFWPQYFHLMDLLEMPDLEQPEMPFQVKWDFLENGQELHPILLGGKRG